MSLVFAVLASSIFSCCCIGEARVVALIVFIFSTPKTPWLSSLAYYVLDLSLLRAMTTSIDAFEEREGLVSVLHEAGFETILYYCCPESGMVVRMRARIYKFTI
jgi:hypothetical protein